VSFSLDERNEHVVFLLRRICGANSILKQENHATIFHSKSGKVFSHVEGNLVSDVEIFEAQLRW